VSRHWLPENDEQPPHEDVLTRLKPSPIHGVGVIAISAIKKDTRLFSQDSDEMRWIDAGRLPHSGQRYPGSARAPSEYTDAMGVPDRLPSKVDVVVIGAGFAGASVAASLTRSGVTSGVVLERELLPGSHASGRNAAMARQLGADPILRTLAIQGVQRLRTKTVAGCPVLRQSGGL